MFHNGLKASLNSHPYSFATRFYYICSSFSSVMSEPGGPGGPICGRSVNPIPSGEGQIIPTYYNCPPKKIFSPTGITVHSSIIEKGFIGC